MQTTTVTDADGSRSAVGAGGGTERRVRQAGSQGWQRVAIITVNYLVHHETVVASGWNGMGGLQRGSDQARAPRNYV